MFWNKKKKENTEMLAEELEEATEPTEEADADFDYEGLDEESEELDEDGANDEDDSEELVKPKTVKVVTVKIRSLDDLAQFANKRGNGIMQFMSKTTHEAFELRDAHLRLARIWGTVTMVRECSPDEYARVMLAMELIEDKDKFYLVPGLTESEIQQAIEDFCRDVFNLNGKKYSRKPERFTKLVDENEKREEWDEYTKALVYDKLEAFCEENGIEFTDGEVTSEETDGE